MSLRTLLLFVLVLLLAAPAAQAATTRGSCIPGDPSAGRCDVQTGTAPFGADDGDTFDVHVDGTPKGTYAHVRLTGVQAMELSDYNAKVGECKAVDADARVTELLRRAKGKVRLSARKPESTSRKRPLRSVAVKVRGRWIDVGTDLLKSGLGLWLPSATETQVSASYGALTERARKLQLGLFDPDGCGAGFQQGLPIQLWVNGNPEGADDEHLDDEYIAVRNNDPVQTLDLSGWWVRDSGLRRYVLAPGTLVGPGQTLTVRVGRGTDGPLERWWGLKKAVFDNQGDGAFLFDPEGDVRAAMVYPCRYQCADGLTGLVGVEAHPRGREHVKLTSQAQVPVSLNAYRLRYRGITYAFGADDVLAPGESLRLDVQGYPEDDVHGRKGWDRVSATLRDAGGNVTLETFDGITVGCSAWGSGSCDPAQ